MPDDQAGRLRRKSARPRGTSGRGIDAAPQLHSSPLTKGHTHAEETCIGDRSPCSLWPALIVAQKTSYDYEKTANFAGFKTYAHKRARRSGSQLIDDRIVAAIETQLGAKGLTKV